MNAQQAYDACADELFAIVSDMESNLCDVVANNDAIHWGHVGDMGRALEMAKQLRDFLTSQVKGKQ